MFTGVITTVREKIANSIGFPQIKGQIGVSSLLLDISNGKLLALQVPVLVQITESRYCIKDANKCDAHY